MAGRGAQDGPARDFRGYGRHIPRVRWPGDASLVVNIVLNYESGAEYSLLDGDGRNDSWGEYSDQIPPDVRDMGTETHFEFGSRAGIWRLARLFDSYQVPVTIGACARGLERNPEVADWIAEAGHDVIGHGYRWAENSAMTREQERDDLRQGIEAIERLTGERPLGWYVRSFPSVRTRELIVEEGGFLYDSDASNDELPYFTDVGSAPFLVVPYSKVYNDNRYLISPTYSTPNDFFESLRAAVSYLCDEAAAGHGARMMTVGLHERWSGQASRATAIRDFVEYVQSRPDVRFMRRLDIARWWLAHHAEWAPPGPRSGGQAAEAARTAGNAGLLLRSARPDRPAGGFGNRVGLLSSALPGLDAAAVCAQAAGAGLSGVEWAASPGDDLLTSAAQAAELGRLAATHGLAVCGLSAQDPGAASGPAGDFERLLELAGAMGAPQLCVFAPPYAGGDVADELLQFADQLAELASLAAGAGVRLLVEMAPGTLAPGPDWFRRIAASVPPELVGAVYDPGSMVIEGSLAPSLAIAALGPYLQHAHVKDMVPRRAGATWGWAAARPGAGLVSWPDVLTALATAGYGGWLVIDQLSGPAGRAGPGRLPGDVAALRRLVTGAATGVPPGASAAPAAAPRGAASPAPDGSAVPAGPVAPAGSAGSAASPAPGGSPPPAGPTVPGPSNGR
jgi:sugar phosphate isomerase/epimerase/peptidoglycan/xylan/chitin deacetylase (PgdA/CDA1 family)